MNPLLELVGGCFGASPQLLAQDQQDVATREAM